MVDSVDAVEFNFSIWNNADYQKTWSLLDKTTGDHLPLDGCQLLMELKETQQVGAADVLKLEMQDDPDLTGFYWLTDDNEDFQVTIRKADIVALIPEGSKKKSLFYDLLVLYPDGYVLKYAYGKLTITMGSGDGA